MSNYIRFNSNPITDYLTDNWQQIRDEYISYMQEKMSLNMLEVQSYSNKLNPVVPRGTTKEMKPLYTGNIVNKPLYVKKVSLGSIEQKMMNWKENEEERFWPDSLKNFPVTARWINNNSNICSGIYFATAQPGSKINHHYGIDTNYPYLRMHLGLITDHECLFNLENEQYAWKDGDLFAFDDNVVYHGIKHNGTIPRTVLIIDILKSVMRDYVINYPTPRWYEDPFVSRHDRVPPVITNW